MRRLKVSAGETIEPGTPLALDGEGCARPWREGDVLRGRTLTEEEARAMALPEPPVGYIHIALYFDVSDVEVSRETS